MKLGDDWTLHHGQEGTLKEWKREGKDYDVEDVEEAFNQRFSIKSGRGVCFQWSSVEKQVSGVS